MTNMIDTSNWKSFRVSDVFITEKHGSKLQTPTGSMMSKKDLVDGDIPRVTVSNFNNGITGYYADSNNKNYRTYENFVSVGFLGTVFYQPERASLDMKVHCLKPLDYELNAYSAGYIVSIIRKAISNYAYSDQLSSTILAELKLTLPTTSNGCPDWSYMESYMKTVMEDAEKDLENLKKADSTKHRIDIDKWGKFRIGDLFNMSLSKDDIQPKSISDGNIPLISSGKTNNGIVAYIQDDKATIQQTKTITVDMFGKAFYQANPYYCVSHGRVNILTPKFNINEYIGLFIANIIEKVANEKYKFDSMCTGAKLAEDIIYLPITTTGEPDWQYMENYMKFIIKKSELDIAMLQSGMQV